MATVEGTTVLGTASDDARRHDRSIRNVTVPLGLVLIVVSVLAGSCSRAPGGSSADVTGIVVDTDMGQTTSWPCCSSSSVTTSRSAR